MSDLEKASEEAHSHHSHDPPARINGDPARNLPPDPDAHLSPEERAQIVRYSYAFLTQLMIWCMR